MGKFDKQLKYSIRKVSVGAASVVIVLYTLPWGQVWYTLKRILLLMEGQVTLVRLQNRRQANLTV